MFYEPEPIREDTAVASTPSEAPLLSPPPADSPPAKLVCFRDGEYVAKAEFEKQKGELEGWKTATILLSIAAGLFLLLAIVAGINCDTAQSKLKESPRYSR